MLPPGFQGCAVPDLRCLPVRQHYRLSCFPCMAQIGLHALHSSLPGHCHDPRALGIAQPSGTLRWARLHGCTGFHVLLWCHSPSERFLCQIAAPGRDPACS